MQESGCASSHPTELHIHIHIQQQQQQSNKSNLISYNAETRRAEAKPERLRLSEEKHCRRECVVTAIQPTVLAVAVTAAAAVAAARACVCYGVVCYTCYVCVCIGLCICLDQSATHIPPGLRFLESSFLWGGVGTLYGGSGARPSRLGSP